MEHWNRQETTDRRALLSLTRELEVLISAALVISLLQLPGVLDTWFNARYLHLEGTAFGVIFSIYYVGKLISYGLIAAFTIHFLARGFWVAIWGLENAFPHGSNLEKADLGPVTTRVFRERIPSLQTLERAVDRFASSIFAFVFIFVLQLLVISLAAMLSWLVAVLLALIPGVDAGIAFIVVFTVYFLSIAIPALLDKGIGKGWVSRRLEGSVRRAITFLSVINLSALSAPLFLTFASNVSRKRIALIQTVFIYVLVGVFAAAVFSDVGLLRYDSYLYYPGGDRTNTIDHRYYRDSLGSASVEVPHIDSRVLSGSWIPLFVPYDASEDNERLRTLCDAEPLRNRNLDFRLERTGDDQGAELLECVDQIYSVAIDDEPLSPDWSFYREPSTNVPGWFTMLDASELADGKHVLTVEHVPLPKGLEDDRADEFHIPFWK